eukprot:TRINITY_DN7134_c1_g2_i2.p3 TRINITY_DN7134_c1_g2~~TRINITY_DN7134_c1_g2_i2.p3  ORF type:complete len:139 (-),score=7.05 TRINITY_DN7134_c1_g2_i2:770-1186(-)
MAASVAAQKESCCLHKIELRGGLLACFSRLHSLLKTAKINSFLKQQSFPSTTGESLKRAWLMVESGGCAASGAPGACGSVLLPPTQTPTDVAHHLLLQPPPPCHVAPPPRGTGSGPDVSLLPNQKQSLRLDVSCPLLD